MVLIPRLFLLRGASKHRSKIEATALRTVLQAIVTALLNPIATIQLPLRVKYGPFLGIISPGLLLHHDVDPLGGS